VAARQKRENAPSDPVTNALHAEIVSALRRLVAIEGSIAATARVLQIIAPSLELKRQELSRWLQRGSIPAGALKGDRQQALLFAIVARLKRYDTDQPARDARDRKIKESEAAREILQTFRQKKERKRFIETLRGWCRRHGEVAQLRGIRQSGVQRFADELGVRAALLREALRPGEESVSVKLFLAFRRFEQREREQAEEDAIDRAKMDVLLQLTSVPKVVIRKGKIIHEPVPAKIVTGDAEFSGQGTFGWRWTKKFSTYLLPRLHPSGKDAWKVVEDFVRFALEAPGLLPAERYPEWNVYALGSRLGENEVGSKQEHRRIEGNDDSRRFVVNEAYSSGNRRPPRARQRAISSVELDEKTGSKKLGFVQRIAEGIESLDVIYLHGGVVWNFRRRTPEEQQRRDKAWKESQELEKGSGVWGSGFGPEKSKKKSRKKTAKKTTAQRARDRKKVLRAVLARREERKRK